MTEANNRLFFHQNLNNSILAMSEKEGAIVARYWYDPFGYNYLEESKSINDRLFMGCEFDNESNNYFFRARTYSPLLGRFLQFEPFVNIDGLNNYAFVHNSPITNTDPSGYILLKGHISNTDCSDYNGPTISNPPYNGPTISNPPYNGPSFSSPPTPPEPDYNLPNLNFEAGGCIAAGGGICASFKRGVDNNGNLYEGFSFSPVVGAGVSGSISGSVGNTNPKYGFDTGLRAQATGSFDGVGLSGSASYSSMNNSGGYDISGGIGSYSIGGSAQTGGHGNGSASFGAGASYTAGGYFSWTWQVK